MRDGLRLGRWRGVDVGVDWSGLAIVALLVVSFATLFFAGRPGSPAGLGLALAFGAAVLVVTSIAARELVHVLVSRKLGIPVSSTTFFLLGSVSRPPDHDARGAWREAIAASVGPATHFVLAAIMLGIATATAGAITPENAAWTGPVVWLLASTGLANIGVGVFNLLPALPLDGGRLLHAALWASLGDRTRATNLAARIGQAVALVVIFIGVSIALGVGVRLGVEGLIVGLWLSMLGWAVFAASSMVATSATIEERLRGLTTRQLMRVPVSIDAAVSIAGAVADFFVREDEVALAVRDGDLWLGVLRFEDVRRAPASEWEKTEVRAAMTPAEQIPTSLTPSEDASAALAVLQRTGWEALPVVDGAHLVGMLERRDLIRWLEVATTAGSIPAGPAVTN